MLNPRTLGSIIATEDYSGLRVEDGQWFLDQENIEFALYGNTVSHWDDHADTFFASVKTEVVHIQAWICSDTLVGLFLFVVENRPVAVIWQTGRKLERQIAFVDKDARSFFQSLWEKYRPEPKWQSDFLSAEALLMPISQPDHDPYEIDDASQAHDLYLSMEGLAAWVKDHSEEGCFTPIHDEATLTRAAHLGQKHLADLRSEFSEILVRPPGTVTPEILKEVEGLVESNNRFAELFQSQVQAQIEGRLHALSQSRC